MRSSCTVSAASPAAIACINPANPPMSVSNTTWTRARPSRPARTESGRTSSCVSFARWRAAARFSCPARSAPASTALVPLSSFGARPTSAWVIVAAESRRNGAWASCSLACTSNVARSRRAAAAASSRRTLQGSTRSARTAAMVTPTPTITARRSRHVTAVPAPSRRRS